MLLEGTRYEGNGEAANKLVKIIWIYIKIREQICFDTDNRVSDIKLVYRDRYTSLKIFSVKTLLTTLRRV